MLLAYSPKTVNKLLLLVMMLPCHYESCIIIIFFFHFFFFSFHPNSPSIHCRPLTAAVAAAGRGHITLDGSARMRERPIQDLVDGLTQLGVDAQCTAGTGCPPVTVHAQGLPSGKVVQHKWRVFHANMLVFTS